MRAPSVSSGFQIRNLAPEQMDDPNLGPKEHARALRGLARLHRLGRSADLVWPIISRELQIAGGSRLSLLDVACGRADLLATLSLRAHGRLECTGVDISARALDLARRRAPSGIRFIPLDVRSETLPSADIVLCSLFLHHLEDDDGVRLLARMGETANRLVIVSDLLRSRLSYYAVRIGAFLATRSPVVWKDSGLSVRAAFTPRELERLAWRAGLRGAVVRPRFPCRLLLTWDARRP